MPVNKIDGLPSVEDIQNELNNEQTSDQAENKKRSLRPILIVLAIIAVLLGSFAILTGKSILKSGATGIISGNVTNESGTPIPAEIYVVSTKLSTVADTQGNFVLGNIPVGENEVLVAFQGQGVEVPVVIQKDQNSSLGSIQIRSTQIPTK
jgi:hypothetical protein